MGSGVGTWNGRTRAVALGLAVLVVVASRPAWSGTCPPVAADAFAFLSDEGCLPDPVVRWPDARVVFDCRFFADPDTGIDCGGDAATCVQLCRASAQSWNAGLPGRFSFAEATPAEPVDFCDGGDGRTSIGGSRRFCDGGGLGSNTLAVTSLFFFERGPLAGRITQADIVVNQAFEFDQESFQAAVTHELGHVLGLDHPDECGRDFNVVMRSSDAFAPGSPCYVVEPTFADLNGGARIYELVGPTPSPTPGPCGDADQNGSITVTDGVQTLRAAAALPSDCTPARCDVDGNGTISVTDGVQVLRAAALLPFTPRCPS